MADADEVWRGIDRAPAVRYSALVPNLRGARRALDAGLTEIEAVVSASDTHNRKNVSRSTEESLDDIAVIIDEAHQRGVTCQVIISTAWGCPVRGRRAGARGWCRWPGARSPTVRLDLVRRHHRDGDAARVWSLVGEFRSAIRTRRSTCTSTTPAAPGWPTCWPRSSSGSLTSTLR